MRRLLSKLTMASALSCVLVVGAASVAQATPASAPTASAAPVTGHVVASGPGYVIVGEGAPIRSTAPLTVTATGNQAIPLSVTNCGWVSCSFYLSRAQTKSLNYNIAVAGGFYAGAGAFCAAAALISGIGAVFVGIGCAALWAIYGGFLWNALTHAAADNGCLRIRYGVLGFAFYDDHSGYCHNS